MQALDDTCWYSLGMEINEATRQRFQDRLTEPDAVTGCQVLRPAPNTVVGTSLYPTFSVNGKPYKGHRVAWLMAHGRFPQEGLQLDHLCRNTRCVRVDHLDEVTQSVNMQRAADAAQPKPYEPVFVTDSEYVNRKQAAEILSVNPRTLDRLLANGTLKKYQTRARHVLLLRTDVERLATPAPVLRTPTPERIAS